MDAGTTLVALVIVLITIFPFVLINRKRKKIRNIYISNLTSLAQSKNCSIHQHEISGSSIIGMDHESRMVFYLRNAAEQEPFQQICLAGIRKCSAEKLYRIVTTGNDNYRELDKVSLLFTYRNKSDADTSFEFFNAVEDRISVSDQVFVTEKWAKILNDSISTGTETQKKVQ